LERQRVRRNCRRCLGYRARARICVDAAAPSPDQLRAALKQWNPDVPVALAAPGLSPHGQGRAFDFQVERDGQVIAGAAMASATRQWDAAGWTQKLHAAVIKAGPHFAGPLDSPYEPWHYSYAPKTTTPNEAP